jgi:ABC-type multidrug transport system permease subunit
MPIGFLGPSNTSVVPVQQKSAVLEFTGAALSQVRASYLQWMGFNWHVGVFGLCTMFGAAVLWV